MSANIEQLETLVEEELREGHAPPAAVALALRSYADSLEGEALIGTYELSFSLFPDEVFSALQFEKPAAHAEEALYRETPLKTKEMAADAFRASIEATSPDMKKVFPDLSGYIDDFMRRVQETVNFPDMVALAMQYGARIGQRIGNEKNKHARDMATFTLSFAIMPLYYAFPKTETEEDVNDSNTAESWEETIRELLKEDASGKLLAANARARHLEIPEEERISYLHTPQWMSGLRDSIDLFEQLMRKYTAK